MASDPGTAARRRAAAVAMVVSAVLIVVKLALAVATGSVAILAEAAHSAANLLASLVAALGARHGSGTAGAFEGVLVVAASLVIAFAAIRTLGDAVDAVAAGLVGLACCAAAAGIASAYVGGVARETGSRALAADAAHLSGTAATSSLVAATLGLVALTGLHVLDALTALGIAAVVARSGIDLVRAVRPGDEALDADEIAAVSRALAAGPPTVVGYRRLRARTVSGVRRIDVDVTVRRDVTPAQVANIRAAIGRALEESLPEARIVIHIVRPGSPGRPARSRRVP